MRDYHYTKFGSIWDKESKVTEGGRGGLLNRPSEIGLKAPCMTKLQIHAHFSLVVVFSLNGPDLNRSRSKPSNN